MIKDIKKLVKYVSVFRPRLLHLQAYFALLGRSQNSAMNLAKKCADAAERMGNILECKWANHSMQVLFSSCLDCIKDAKTSLTLPTCLVCVRGVRSVHSKE